MKKGCGYHLDLFVLAILIWITGALGIPIYVAATVLSINHVNSLKVESESRAPGERPTFIGVRSIAHFIVKQTALQKTAEVSG